MRFRHHIVAMPLLLGLALVTTPGSVFAQGQGDVEAKFVGMLKDATLNGSWAPIRQGALGQERDNDRYQIARVEKQENGTWNIVSVISIQGRSVEFPIPSDVKFAGDTAVLILNNVRAGRGQANWSARVMFHEDVYTGRWWETDNVEHGGTISGTITRSRATD